MKPPRTAPSRPVSGEYPPYAEAYLSLVPAGDIVAILESQIEELARLFATHSEQDGEFRYAPGKWSVK
jgi:hypothetical protein